MKEKCLNILRNVSLGKHGTKLYYENKMGEYSTVTGGIITISVAFVLLVTSVNILISTFKRENYTTTTFYSDLETSDLI
jgi:hypothetical protein